MKGLFFLFLITFTLAFVILIFFNQDKGNVFNTISATKWEVRSIDTMKTSRDLARGKLDDSSYDRDINVQMSAIAGTGANYVAIGTPYDEEFVPYLTRWVKAARKYHLHIWFRGNFSGWEGWFDYPRIDEATHLTKTQQFIVNHNDLFAEGDIFTPCPECENGVNLQANKYAQLNDFRTFLINEYTLANKEFSKVNKKVNVGYYSMNGDVAKMVMDRQTTKSLGGIVVVDHYVKSPEKLVNDLVILAKQSGGSIILGEVGAPIPSTHGKMSDQEQAEWIHSVFSKLSQAPEVIGVNYWVNTIGTTAIWQTDGTPKPAVSVIKKFYDSQK